MKTDKSILLRIVILVVAIALEILLTISIIHWLADKAEWIEIVIRILSVLIVLTIVKNSKHLSMDVVWIIVIVLTPIPGTIAYLLLGADLISSRTYNSIKSETEKAKAHYIQDESVKDEIKSRGGDLATQFNYIADSEGFSFYRNESFDYYGLGEEGYPYMLEEMKKAKKFIFIEYFIIDKGKLWDSFLEILKEKVAEGVEVRVMYDDIGSMFTLNQHYAETLEKQGIKCITFNKVSPILNIIVNHRDHRKIMVIDGKVAFSGGINLADEYINEKELFGKWKDNIIRVKGDAVWSFTVMFLTHWNALRHEDDDYTKFKADPALIKAAEAPAAYDGYISPYGETPLDNENMAQDIYMSIINNAKKYCYISSPYLIIDSDFVNCLILAAKSGVDVRIVTPGVPDKKFTYAVTSSYFYQLIEGGVKIYSYTPGFNHAKVFVSDDIVATVGTVNLDYRSLYLHFENGAYLYDSEKVKDVKADLDSMIEESHEITLKESKRGPVQEFFDCVLRLLAPLM